MYLEVCHPCLLSLQQSFKLQVRLHLVEEHHLAVHVLPGGVEEVCKEPTDAAVGDVAAHDDELLLLICLAKSDFIYQCSLQEVVKLKIEIKTLYQGESV